MQATNIPNYRYVAAGQVWLIPSLQLVRLPDGSEAITEAEIQRIHTAIANEICGDPAPLTIDELEFLCDITLTPLNEVAKQLGLHKSTLSKWRAAGQISKPIYSTQLKKVFWFKLFGDRLAEKLVPLQTLEDDRQLLRYVHNQAIEECLAEPIERAAA